MTDATEPGAMTPEAAQAQRATLMADATFRAGAMDSKGPQWQRLSALDRSSALPARRRVTRPIKRPRTQRLLPLEVSSARTPSRTATR
jgi:hypothetical protein